MTLEDLYHLACRQPSDINQHLPTLYRLAKQCRHVTEFGTRTAVSTTAFLYAQPDYLVCYDLTKHHQVDQLQELAGRTQFTFHKADVLTVDIDETDLLFVDTWHVYDQLKQELALHSSKVRRWIVLHDTCTFGCVGETAGHKGLWPAVEEFLTEGTFRVTELYPENNGLTVMERIT